jgi:hypothetical protein
VSCDYFLAQRRRVQATGSVRPAPPGSANPLPSRRGATSRPHERSGGQRNGASAPAGCSLDGEPPDGRVQRAEAWADADLALTTRAQAGAEGGRKRPRTPARRLCAFGARSHTVFQASARGTDAERARHVQRAGGVITALSCDEGNAAMLDRKPLEAARFIAKIRAAEPGLYWCSPIRCHAGEPGGLTAHHGCCFRCARSSQRRRSDSAEKCTRSPSRSP